jgi:hypothetical protein
MANLKYRLGIILMALVCQCTSVFGQDCIDYHRITCPRANPNPYTEVPEGSKSELVLRGELIKVSFHIYQGRDYRMTVCSEMYNGEVVVKLFDFEDPTMLLYDNTLNEMAQEFEFQVMRSRRVRAEVFVPAKPQQQQAFGMLTQKVPRGCVGLLLETMVTRK